MESSALFNLSGKRAIVTGASGGFGEHFAKVLADAGAEVVLAARRLEKLEHVAEAIRARGGVAHPVIMDVTSPESVDAAFADVERICGGPCDIIVNNSGVTHDAWFTKIDEENWHKIIDTNLSGVWRVAKAGANALKAHDMPGSIINISSITAFRTSYRGAAYSASKAAVTHLTQCMALELARPKIRVNAIAPGFFPTDISKDLLDGEHGAVLKDRILMKRYGEFEDLTGPLLLLASQAGAFMTGETIIVDGGHTLTPL